MDTAIIIAIVSLLGTIVTGIFQFRRDKAEIKRVEVEAEKEEITAVSNIADLVLKMYKQELDALREISNDLRERNSYLQEQLTFCQNKIREKDLLLDEVDAKLKECMKDKICVFEKLEECHRDIVSGIYNSNKE